MRLDETSDSGGRILRIAESRGRALPSGKAPVCFRGEVRNR